MDNDLFRRDFEMTNFELEELDNSTLSMEEINHQIRIIQAKIKEYQDTIMFLDRETVKLNLLKDKLK